MQKISTIGIVVFVGLTFLIEGLFWFFETPLLAEFIEYIPDRKMKFSMIDMTVLVVLLLSGALSCGISFNVIHPYYLLISNSLLLLMSQHNYPINEE